MNILHMKYAVVVAEEGSLSKASKVLLIAQPNISRSIKELEADLGITIFDRTTKGMTLTSAGEEFMYYAKGILRQIEHVERIYKEAEPNKQKFSISVPRACYIADAFTQFTKTLNQDATEVFYKETNSQRTINNLLNKDYSLGIIRYAENYEKYFTGMLEEKGFHYEMVTQFTYRLIMSKNSPLANKKVITFDDLDGYIEIAHADPYVPSLSLAKVIKEELPDNMNRRIYIFERGSQFNIISENTETFMWVSPTPEHMLERYGLVQRECINNKKVYNDILVYKKGYQLTKLDHQFIEELQRSKAKHIGPA